MARPPGVPAPRPAIGRGGPAIGTLEAWSQSRDLVARGPWDGHMARPATGAPSPRRSWLVRLTVFALVASMTSTAAIWTDALGTGRQWQRVVDKVDRLLAGPVPDRPTLPTIVVAEEAPLAATPSPAPTARSSGSALRPSASAAIVAAAPTVPPARTPLDLQLTIDPKAVFAHELVNTWCAPAGIQSILTILGRGTTSPDLQRQIAGRVHEFEAWADAHDGGWGPAAMAQALAAYGVPGYEVRAYPTRDQAIRDSAVALERTSSPVILLTWYGAHTWVMTGFRADADPLRDPTAVVSGAYILDPWYPTISSIWGASDPPGFFHDTANLTRNFLAWKRPEGTYPDRDGRFIVVIPTIPRDSGG